MPAAHPPEFRQRVVELAFERAKPIAQIARDLGIEYRLITRYEVVGADTTDHLAEEVSP